MLRSPVPAGQGPTGPHVPDPQALATQTQECASHAYATVSTEYLAFRRNIYHEANPTLATEPHALDEVQQGEPARLANGALRVLPSAVKSVPIVGELVHHLQRVADIHTLTETERMTLHNITMVFLYGVRDGIQAWYVEYMLESAQRLAHIKNFDYYISFPWHALFYKPEAELAAFDQAVRSGDSGGIEQAVEHLRLHLIAALHNPYEAQEQLAFSGPDGDRHRMLFNLKTTAGLALGAYLAAETVRTFIGPHQAPPPQQSVISLIPNQMSQHLIQRPTEPGAAPLAE